MLNKTNMSLLPEIRKRAMQRIRKNDIEVLVFILILWRRSEFL